MPTISPIPRDGRARVARNRRLRESRVTDVTSERSRVVVVVVVIAFFSRPLLGKTKSRTASRLKLLAVAALALAVAAAVVAYAAIRPGDRPPPSDGRVVATASATASAAASAAGPTASAGPVTGAATTNGDYFARCAPRVACDPDAVYRTYNGSCNNLQRPVWGASLTPFYRLMDAQFADGTWTRDRQSSRREIVFSSSSSSFRVCRPSTPSSRHTSNIVQPPLRYPALVLPDPVHRLVLPPRLFFITRSRLDRGVPGGIFPTGFSSAVILVKSFRLRTAGPAHRSLWFPKVLTMLSFFF